MNYFSDGSLLVWRASSGQLQFKILQCHSSEISSVGLHKNLIVSGSRDRTVKVNIFNCSSANF